MPRRRKRLSAGAQTHALLLLFRSAFIFSWFRPLLVFRQFGLDRTKAKALATLQENAATMKLPSSIFVVAAAVGSASAYSSHSSPDPAAAAAVAAAISSNNIMNTLNRLLTDHDRTLQSDTNSNMRQCNAQIGTMARDDIASILSLLFQDDAEILSYVDTAILPLLKYDVASYKICGSCQDLYGADADDNAGDNGKGEMMSPVPEACNSDMYGYDAHHSSLVLVPLDAATGQIVEGSLRAEKVYHGTRGDVGNVPTNTYPESLEGLQSGDPEVIGSILASIGEVNPVLASVGNVVIAPDYLGYGESAPTHNRTYIIRQSYEQAAIVSWLSTQEWIYNESGGCTILENTASLEGTSEGGYAALAASSALEKMGIRILNARLNVPAISLTAIAVWMMEQYDNGLVTADTDSASFQLFLPLNGWAYSQDLPHLPNTGYPDQTLLASEWMVPDNFEQNIPAWLETPDPISSAEIFAIMPPFAPDILHPAMVQLIRDAIAINSTTPCSTFDDLVERGVDKLCEAAVDDDLTPLLTSANYPTELCYSQADTVIPAFQFTDEVYQNSFVSRAVNVDGSPTGDGGDHIAAAGVCIFANLLGHLTFGLVPGTDPDDLPFLITPLEGDAAESCGAGSTGTPSPTPGTTSGTPVQEPTEGAPTDSSSATSSFAARYWNALLGVGVALLLPFVIARP